MENWTIRMAVLTGVLAALYGSISYAYSDTEPLKHAITVSATMLVVGWGLTAGFAWERRRTTQD